MSSESLPNVSYLKTPSFHTLNPETTTSITYAFVDGGSVTLSSFSAAIDSLGTPLAFSEENIDLIQERMNYLQSVLGIDVNFTTDYTQANLRFVTADILVDGAVGVWNGETDPGNK